MDALRGVAAILVVMHHLPVYLHIEATHRILQSLENLQLMVDLFFVISGFILTGVYIERLNTFADVTSFVAYRVARLYPLHLYTMISCGLLALFFTDEIIEMINGAYSNDLRNLVLNLTLTQKIGLERSWSFNTPSWSISTEFWVNILFVIVIFAGKRATVWIALTLTVLCTFVLLRISSGWLSAPKFGHIDASVYRTMAGFFAGVVTYHLHASRPDWLRGTVSGILATIAVLLIALVVTASNCNPLIDAFVSILLCPLLILSITGIQKAEEISSAWPLRWCGDVSFSIYLWQMPLAMVMRGTGLIGMVESKAIMVAIYFIVLAVVANLSLRRYELPMRSYINSLWASKAELDW